MWSQETPQGKVKYVERYEHPITGKQCYVSVTMSKDSKSNRKAAQGALEDKIEQKIGDLLAATKKEDLRLSKLVSLYRQDQKSTVSKSTYQRNYFAADSLMRILGEDTLVERLSAGYVRKCLADQNEKPGTTNERIARLKALMRWGYENDYVNDIRWLDKLKKFKDDEKARKLEEKYLEGEELKMLLSHMAIDAWRFLAEFTALSGLRVGEAIALNAADVDLGGRTITVTKTYDPVNEIVTTPKTPTSNREVYIQDELLLLCKEIKLHTKKRSLLLGYRTRLFLSDCNGGYLSYYAYNKYLKETACRLFDKKVTSHFMRHTHVALMAEQGLSLDMISRRVGHADSRVTKDIYFHVTEKMKERDNAQIKEIKIL